jgi:hypothetical protein
VIPLRANPLQAAQLRCKTPRRVTTSVRAMISAILLFLAQQPPADLAISPPDRARIIEAAACKIEATYVDEAKGKEIAAALRAATFDAETALRLVPAVNQVLRTASGDLHLRFGYSHEAVTKSDDAPETEEERVAAIRDAREDGFGIQGVQRLDGNIGLLTWRKFYEPELAGDAVAAAMRLLSGTDALIIDLRESAGGAPEMVQMLMSYFVPEGDPIQAFTIYNRVRDLTHQFWTLPYVPGPRYAGKDVYILTSKQTWSAAEGFTEHMRRLELATVVGETTRGGAHLGRFFTVDPHFAVCVPVSRVLPPAVDWEGKGVPPDIAVDAARALDTALERARAKRK